MKTYSDLYPIKSPAIHSRSCIVQTKVSNKLNLERLEKTVENDKKDKVYSNLISVPEITSIGIWAELINKLTI